MTFDKVVPEQRLNLRFFYTHGRSNSYNHRLRRHFEYLIGYLCYVRHYKINKVQIALVSRLSLFRETGHKRGRKTVSFDP